MDRIDEVLHEAGRVRAELGYPIMVTPFSQFVGVQAVFNVVQGQRYKTIPKELTLYALGHYGATQAPIDPNVLDRILGGKSLRRAVPEALYGERILESFRIEAGPFASDEELLLHLFYGKPVVEAFQREQRIVLKAPSIKRPLRVLLEELAKAPRLASFSLQKGDLKLEIGH